MQNADVRLKCVPIRKKEGVESLVLGGSSDVARDGEKGEVLDLLKRSMTGHYILRDVLHGFTFDRGNILIYIAEYRGRTGGTLVSCVSC